MESKIRYIKSVTDGLLSINDYEADKGVGISVSLSKGQVIDLLEVYTMRRVQESPLLKLALNTGTVISLTEEEYKKEIKNKSVQNKEEIKIVPHIRQPEDDNQPFLKELAKVEDESVRKGEMMEGKRMTRPLKKG